MVRIQTLLELSNQYCRVNYRVRIGGSSQEMESSPCKIPCSTEMEICWLKLPILRITRMGLEKDGRLKGGFCFLINHPGSSLTTRKALNFPELVSKIVVTSTSEKACTILIEYIVFYCWVTPSFGRASSSILRCGRPVLLSSLL
jgi:hypothetical protein